MKARTRVVLFTCTSIFGVVFLLAIVCSEIRNSCRPRSWRHTPEEERAAVEFQFDGVSFSTTLADFQRQLPDAEISGSSPGCQGVSGKVGFHWRPKNAARSAYATFFDDQLCHMMIYYDPEDCRAVIKELYGKFGLPEKSDEEKPDEEMETRWRFRDEIHRAVGFSMEEMSLSVVNLEVFQRQMDRKDAEEAEATAARGGVGL